MSRKDLLSRELTEIEMLTEGIKARMADVIKQIQESDAPLGSKWRAFKRACKSCPAHKVSNYYESFSAFDQDDVIDDYRFQWERDAVVNAVEFYNGIVSYLYENRRNATTSNIDVLKSVKAEIIEKGVTGWHYDW